MKVDQILWREAGGWTVDLAAKASADVDLILVFADRKLLERSGGALLNELQQHFNAAVIAGCSTVGEIYCDQVVCETLVATLCSFDGAQARVAEVAIDASGDIGASAKALIDQLSTDGLRHVFVFSDGLAVNGTELARAVQSRLPDAVLATGGLAADGALFEQTYVIARQKIMSRALVAVGLYGESLVIGSGSMGGWDTFGVDRLITRSQGNVLFELDGQPALDLYKRYLGEHARDLPASGLRFPLSVRTPGEPELVRTILAVDEQQGSIIFAGDMPEGAVARLMKANHDRLVDGAALAAEHAAASTNSDTQLALLISCIGRRLLLQQRIEEEIDAVQDTLGQHAVLCGFYSYGELAPLQGAMSCQLHNQTMTITTLAERPLA